MMWCDAIGGMTILGAQGAAILRAANNCISQRGYLSCGETRFVEWITWLIVLVLTIGDFLLVTW